MKDELKMIDASSSVPGALDPGPGAPSHRPPSSVLRPFQSLRRFTRAAPQPDEEQCDFCGDQIAPDHRHLLETVTRQVRCVCRACSILFDQKAASEGKYQLIPDRRTLLRDFQMTDAQWEGLRIPVAMAFFYKTGPRMEESAAAGPPVAAFYPSPMGATESLLQLSAWADLEALNPALEEMQPDVEALLVNRTREAREYFVVPIDDCYRLVAIIRTHWKGLSGGEDVWNEIDRFFGALRTASE